MSDEAQKRRLGRGLAALIGDMEPEATMPDRVRAPKHLPIEFLEANPRNPRTSFGADDLNDLVQSIKEKGILQPILVRAHVAQADRYEIIAGERRWRAAQQAGVSDVPVIVRDVSDKEALEIAIVENVQRTDLNPLEEALGYEQLIAEFGYSQGALADVIGKSRSHVANTLRLLKLTDGVKEYLRDGRLTAGHARALVGREDADALADLIVAGDLSVRDAEKLVAPDNENKQGAPRPKRAKDTDTLALETAISECLGLIVDIRHKDNGVGEVRIAYKSLEQLDDIAHRLQTRVGRPV